MTHTDHSGNTALAHAIMWQAPLPVLLAILEAQKQPEKIAANQLSSLGHYLSFTKRCEENYEQKFVESLIRNECPITSVVQLNHVRPELESVKTSEILLIQKFYKNRQMVQRHCQPLAKLNKNLVRSICEFV